MKLKHTFLLVAILLGIGFYILIRTQGDEAFDVAKREIGIRKIGDAILRHAGDSTSRVLPVKKISAEEYELRFEKNFALTPDALVAIIQKSFADEKSDYIINVLNCNADKVVYGYAVSQREKTTAIPCLGRILPYSCYRVNIKFREANPTFKKYTVAVSLLAVAMLLPFVALRHRKNKPGKRAVPDHLISIGTILFDPQNKSLITDEGAINLTTKENKLLSIFAQSPNATIDRAKLQKEIWEDDGVIVGRSLDVFVSKLRKKLESDPAVQLINVHGKGYRLQI